ncbi:thioredoxin [Paenibacillus oryzae]|uniref:Thioredoxin n=1 Tax=Paenibacillus oryzae TaxID=1844972 RepID=A0A1A5YI12_9BACL|nr:redoxin family protein [Paenibacillus oryzae]OBR65209.1 thioredoxin [Paenibacillus oryzae]
MNNIWKRAGWILVIGGIVAALTACGTKQPAQTSGMNSAAGMNKGEAAPAFSLSDLKGESFQLADFQGKKVYVKYWASWCSICLAGLEELNTLAGQTNDFEIITIVAPNYKGEKPSKDFTEWFNRQPYENLHVLLDENGVWAKEFQVRAYPSSYYIGSDGILVKALPGHASNEQIIETLKDIL